MFREAGRTHVQTATVRTCCVMRPRSNYGKRPRSSSQQPPPLMPSPPAPPSLATHVRRGIASNGIAGGLPSGTAAAHARLERPERRRVVALAASSPRVDREANPASPRRARPLLKSWRSVALGCTAATRRDASVASDASMSSPGSTTRSPGCGRAVGDSRRARAPEAARPTRRRRGHPTRPKTARGGGCSRHGAARCR